MQYFLLVVVGADPYTFFFSCIIIKYRKLLSRLNARSKSSRPDGNAATAFSSAARAAHLALLIWSKSNPSEGTGIK
jgi:hypothetical protein